MKIEQWYLGLKGQPKVQKRQLMQLYRSIHLHLRLLPIYRFVVLGWEGVGRLGCCFFLYVCFPASLHAPSIQRQSQLCFRASA